MIAFGGADVSRETMDKLERYVALVEKWTAKINLISRASVPDIWDRHVQDSAQIYALVDSVRHWADIGSGGGFPGIVVAILAAAEKNPPRVTLVESDQRKCAFLRTAIRELELSASVHDARIEALAPIRADVLSARALGDLGQLLGYAERHLGPGGTALFPKGASWKSEDEIARTQWSYDCEAITSSTNPAAAILKIKEIARV